MLTIHNSHDSIRSYYFRFRPLSSIFRPPPSNGLCEDNCVICSCAERPGLCFLKGVINIKGVPVVQFFVYPATNNTWAKRVALFIPAFENTFPFPLPLISDSSMQHSDPEPKSLRKLFTFQHYILTDQCLPRTKIIIGYLILLHFYFDEN